MVLAELGSIIWQAEELIRKAAVIDEEFGIVYFKTIYPAIRKCFIDVKLTRDMHYKIKSIISHHHDLAAGHKIIQQLIVNLLCNLLDPSLGNNNPPFLPQKGKSNVVMFVGLQGHGKTTACTQYAHYYQQEMKGLKAGLVCADTSKPDAFYQLNQNATRVNIPCYGSKMESDPVKIALQGVERFKQQNCDLIILDTSGIDKLGTANHFEQLRQVSEATKPDLVILVVDSNIGWKNSNLLHFQQGQAFKQSVDVGAVILTKMDDHANVGGGCLSRVAATKSPVIFIGTGEHMDEFEVFDVKPFVSRLLGMEDWSEFLDKVHEGDPMDQHPELLQKIVKFEDFKFEKFEVVENLHTYCKHTLVLAPRPPGYYLNYKKRPLFKFMF